MADDIRHAIDEASELNRIATDTLAKLQEIKNLQDLHVIDSRSDEVFADIKDSVIIIDKSQTIVIANTVADRMFGYHPNELVGQPLILLIPERYRAAHTAKQKSFFLDPAPRMFRELHGLRKDGSEFSVEIALQPLGNIAAQPLVMAILREVEPA